MPLANLTGDAQQDFFVDGVTEELTTDLAQIGALRVTSRTSATQAKTLNKPLPQLAQVLNVDAVVEGSVARSGDRVRITVQLIEAKTDKHLWAKSYERNSRDFLGLQDELARDIASEIRVTLTPAEHARLAATHAIDPEAYDDYLRGRYFWARRTEPELKKAKEYFEKAIAKDPAYAPAYSGLADTYFYLGYAWGHLAAQAKRFRCPRRRRARPSSWMTQRRKGTRPWVRRYWPMTGTCALRKRSSSVRSH